jgi:hypothetical protein
MAARQEPQLSRQLAKINHPSGLNKPSFTVLASGKERLRRHDGTHDTIFPL